MGIEVRFVDCKSLEGMYCRAPRMAIFLPSTKHRPNGRVAFSCAHELGHHELGHGTRADEYINGLPRGKRCPEELGADVFAAHFLMPRQAILSATKMRGWTITSLSVEQTYTLASVFGVGYKSLLWQLFAGLQVLHEDHFNDLSKFTPKAIRNGLWEPSKDSNLVILDTRWKSVTVDLELGDVLIADLKGDLDTCPLTLQSEVNAQQVWEATKVGTVRLANASNEVLIRVSQRGYVGSWRYRYLTEGDE